MEAFINLLSNKIGSSIVSYKPISGGDISQAFLIKTEKQDFFLKTNSNSNALDMFRAEQIGLNTIAQTQTIRTPTVIDCNKFGESAYLLTDYIRSKKPTEKDFEKLGCQLAKLHKVTSKEFGFETDNFIGNLYQFNKKYTDWATFYAKERLMPQFKLALQNNLLNDKEIPSELKVIEAVNDFCSDIKPALLHGDLWSGNYLIAQNGEPFLIDPAVYYGHNTVDIAMTQLFGGFSNSFYKSYHSLIPKTRYYEDSIKLYQLYYLLVHLNLFGSSYYGSVKNILNAYF